MSAYQQLHYYKHFDFLCFVELASLYNLVNEVNFVPNLFLVYLSTSTYRLVRRSIRSCVPDSHPHRITSTKCRINTVVSPDDGPIVARNM